MQAKSNSASIFVTFGVTGYHRWPNATERRNYLAATHRHLFGVKVETSVTHDDREIEFHDLLDEAQEIFEGLGDGLEDKGAMSCEAMARELGQALALRHKRPFTVTVSEDDECGATVYSWPEHETDKPQSA